MRKAQAKSSAKTSSKTPRSWARFNWKLIAAAVVLVQFACIGYLAYSIRAMRDSSDRVAIAQAVNMSALSAASAQTHVTVAPADNAVYIPEYRLKLPLNTTTSPLTYSLRDKIGAPDDAAEADISTMALASYPPAMDQVIGCSSAVRIKFEAKSDPYNPHEKNVASVRLADGRSLQAYAYTHPACAETFKLTGVDSMAIGRAFTEAESY